MILSGTDAPKRDAKSLKKSKPFPSTSGKKAPKSPSPFSAWLQCLDDHGKAGHVGARNHAARLACGDYRSIPLAARKRYETDVGAKFTKLSALERKDSEKVLWLHDEVVSEASADLTLRRPAVSGHDEPLLITISYTTLMEHYLDPAAVPITGRGPTTVDVESHLKSIVSASPRPRRYARVRCRFESHAFATAKSVADKVLGAASVREALNNPPKVEVLIAASAS